MNLSKKRVSSLDGEKQSAEIGIFSKKGGIILSSTLNILDQNIYDVKGNPQYFKYLHVGQGGNLVYLSPEGEPDCFLGIPDGAFIPCMGSQVLSTADINIYDSLGNIVDTETVVTTCDSITWKSGE